MRTVILIIGIILTTATVLAMIQSMLMPRASRSIVAHAITHAVSAVLRSPIHLLRTYRAQDRWLAFAPPVAILIVATKVRTHGDPSWWMDQQRLVIGRRADLTIPLALPVDSEAFRTWRDAPGYDMSAWAAYRQ